MYHAFVICIHRIVIIKRYAGRKERNPKSMFRTLFLQIALIWIFSMFLVSIPFGLYGRFGKPLDGCSLNTLFEDNYIHFCAFMDAILVIPQIVMNVVYVYMFRFLFTTWRHSRVRRRQFQSVPSIPSPGVERPSLAEESTSDNGTKSSNLSFRLHRKCIASESNLAIGCEIKCSDRNVTSKVNFEMGRNTNEIDIESTGPCFQNGFCKPSSLDIVKNGTAYHDSVQKFGLRNKPDETVAETAFSHLKSDKNKKHFSKLKRKASKRKSEIKLSYEGQKDVLITVGLILLVVNVTMTPLNMLVVI